MPECLSSVAAANLTHQRYRALDKALARLRREAVKMQFPLRVVHRTLREEVIESRVSL